MRRHSRQWRDDRLGSVLRRGLTRYRDEEPSDEVWVKIATEIEGHRRTRRRGVSLTRATFLSLMLLIGMAATGLSAQLNESAGLTTPRHEEHVLDGLTVDEHLVASRALIGPWDMSLPDAPSDGVRRAAPREAFNRAQWLQPEMPTSRGAARPLTTIVGQ